MHKFDLSTSSKVGFFIRGGIRLSAATVAKLLDLTEQQLPQLGIVEIQRRWEAEGLAICDWFMHSAEGKYIRIGSMGKKQLEWRP